VSERSNGGPVLGGGHAAEVGEGPDAAMGDGI
jgi:hypothetical protein